MRPTIVTLILAALPYARTMQAQGDTAVLVRTAGWNAPTFHFLDIVNTPGRLVLPDIGYVDFGRSNYRELYGAARWSIPENISTSPIFRSIRPRIQYVLDRAKMEQAWHRFKAGGIGAFEFWLQRIPGNSPHFQLRYAGDFLHMAH